MNSNLKKLEFDKILNIISNYSKTYIGKNLISNLRPFANKIDVQKELNETSEAVILIQRNNTPPIGNIEDITKHLITLEANGVLSLKALLELENILKTSDELKKYFNSDFLKTSNFENLENYFNNLYVNSSIVKTFEKSIIDEENLADTASSKLQDIRRKKRNIEQDIRSKLNIILHSSTYSKYMRENIVTIRNGRFVIPVKEEYRGNVKGFVHDISSSGSTVFIEPISVFDLNNDLSNFNSEEELEIERILESLTNMLSPYFNELKENVEIIGKLDFIFSKAKFSLEYKCCTPKLNNEKIINLINARHPLIDKNLVVPISLELGNDFTTLIITGPNTGGKTVTLKTIGLLSAMASSGINIPADEKSSVYVFDNIFADIGDEQSILESLSTFSSHLKNIIDITNNSTSKSLILVDELGSGTDPLEGANLAISILENFSNKGCLTIATSHYQELKQYALITPNFKNASVEFDIENLKPTYRLLIGIPGKSNAFAISRKLGLPEEIINNAISRIDDSSIHIEDILKSIYDEKSRIEDEKKQIEKNLQETEEIKSKIKSHHSDINEKEKELLQNARNEAKQILIDAKNDVDQILKNINTSSVSNANKLRNNLNEKISDLSNKNKQSEIYSEHISREKVKKGLNVFITNLNANGTILSNISKDDSVQVQVGIMKMNIPIKNIQELKQSSNNTSTNITYSQSFTQKSKTINSEINVIGMTVDEAIPIIDKYLDDCYLSKFSPVHIIHGKGTGALRNGIHKYLKTNKIVKNYRLGTFGEGEMGVTIIELKLK